MVLREFPNLDWLKAQIANNFSNKVGWRDLPLKNTGFPSTVLNVQTHACERKDVTGIFSVFMNKQGMSRVAVNGHTLQVQEDFFVLSYPQDSYSLLIDSPTPTEICNFHVSEQNFQQILATLSLPASCLLDNIDFDTTQPYHTPFQTIPKTPYLQRKLAQITQQQEAYAFDELIFEVCSHILQLTSQTSILPQKLQTQRKSTQIELLKRIQIAKEYIHAHYCTPIDINQICQACCLSKFHFIRIFKDVVGITPHQYIQALRINKASILLQNTPLTLQEIAFAVGYENGSTLSKVYKALKGQAPRN